MALTGTHVAGDTGKLADDNLRDTTINGHTAAIAGKITPGDVDIKIANEHNSERGDEYHQQGIARPKMEVPGCWFSCSMRSSMESFNQNHTKRVVRTLPAVPRIKTVSLSMILSFCHYTNFCHNRNSRAKKLTH